MFFAQWHVPIPPIAISGRAWSWLHIFLIPHCIVRPLACFMVDLHQVSFKSYSPSMSSSSCMVASRWAQFCRTAPSIYNGHPTGICDRSRSPSPFCSMIIPSIGTSILAFRLICARLQFHVSGASKSCLASSASAGNSDCSLRGGASPLLQV